jgi:hypothetical protein
MMMIRMMMIRMTVVVQGASVLRMGLQPEW